MEISTVKKNDKLVVAVHGRIDAVTAPQFEKELMTYIAQGEKSLLLNFTEVEYISSAGLRGILAAAKQLKTKQGQLVFSNLRGPVKDVFNISGFCTIFKIFDTEEDALR